MGRDVGGGAKNSKGAKAVFEQKYMEMSSDSGDQSLAVGATSGGKTMYRPKNDLLCHLDNKVGYWYACDNPDACACVSGYSCDKGKWEFCQYGCDEATGK